jgi:hypothetical protein
LVAMQVGVWDEVDWMATELRGDSGHVDVGSTGESW